MTTRQITHLDEAMAEASFVCHASTDKTAVVYYTTNKDVATVRSGELYLVFRGDDPARFHLRDDQGWRLEYTVTAKE